VSLGTLRAADKYQLHQHYLAIEPAVPRLDDTAAHEVVELFWYGCPHCFEFEPHIEIWLDEKPANVKFIRIPAVLNARWESHAKAYYALEPMEALEQGHKLLFEGIHEQGRRLSDLDSIARFLSQHGIDEKEFRQHFESFSVQTKVNRARELGIQYNVTGVPTVIVDGKFKVSGQLAGGHAQVIEIIEQLTRAN
jgi:thiol:disulfide interchange protein DsbA